ncbi:chaperone modulator CbpM [Aquimarina sp. ERC-38]|uniref:chaperone modulator CbpM n=1 Tax=Aquimarina sp. ERC-38 TaxID=2949996 RepID=UPI0022466545|nr:chaperone modulator CbpM [Aquimarina sp. ERC-38]UZO80395.1 chaperone modulator CbpM [Aquimarina sp. ERC-38]
MTSEHLIPLLDFCKNHKVEDTFIRELQDMGLIQVVSVHQSYYIEQDTLPRLEQIVRFNKDLHINVEGVDVILRLLDEMQQVKDEMKVLQKRLRLYEDF